MEELHAPRFGERAAEVTQQASVRSLAKQIEIAMGLNRRCEPAAGLGVRRLPLWLFCQHPACNTHAAHINTFSTPPKTHPPGRSALWPSP